MYIQAFITVISKIYKSQLDKYKKKSFSTVLAASNKIHVKNM